ncbi:MULTISPECIES: LysR family transcriptional regulator [unclassified Enterococcus]|uniref:LysR family transcriptional regulator n=1 Tax=unclassified Enterococcus TaxID=2608891 RepID=UPI001551E341|nr:MULTISPECIES: LysR family transcriptional regulator [unclassified Enterococcus]MBS7577955.1 LysR family transcriptional regulator [Enterococcus sp. MMGLQ5-2]MBS7585184.1 LysR family transcriptional regulator [Enterococcus sp. MMGLQ5-1]NPD13041.1 LysR family transcriptional regulator [Enterococcus sp. MMGLQ5-1]NPD37785.1 LysR family transcriptional regulator [Enterococcus sp. MMGLQ5-2]
MGIRKLEYFIATVEYGSFSNAAQHLYISASAVNQQITALENETKLVLFNRTKYKPVLTASGQIFYQQARQLVDAYYHAIELAHEAAKTLRIGPTGPVERNLLPVLLDAYRTKYSDLEFEFKHGTFKMLRESLLDGSLDVAFGIEDDFKAPMIEIVPLKPLEMVVICAKKHPLATEKLLTGKQLKDIPLVIFSKATGEYYYQNLFKSFKLDGVTPVIHATYDNIDELLTAVRVQKGVAVISKEVVKNQEDIAMIDLKETHHHSSYCVAYAIPTTPLIHSFIQHVIDYFNDIPNIL